jgi:hypothetical protein
MPSGITVDPSEVQSISVDPSEVQDVSAHPALAALSDVAAGAWSKLNPIEMVKGVADTAKAAYAHPLDTAMSVLAHPYLALKRAKDALEAGKPEEAAAHISSALDPTGFATENSQVKMATPGQRATGLGEMIGAGLGAYVGAKVPDVAAAGMEAAKSIGAAVDPAVAKDVLGLVSPRAAHAAAAAGKLRDIVARLLAPKAVAEASPQPPPGSMTIQPSATIAAPPGVPALPQTPAAYNPPVTSTGPLPPAPPVAPANPYFAGASTMDSGALVNRAAQGGAQLPGPLPRPVAEPVTPPEAPVTTPYDATASTLADTYKANAAKADEVKAQWMFDHGITSDQVKAGPEFKKMVDQIPNPNAKSGKFTTRLNDADHPARVEAVKDLLDAKHMQAQARSTAAALDQAGTSPADAASMTPEQLGVKTKTAAANVVFELQKLQAANVAAAHSAQAAP